MSIMNIFDVNYGDLYRYLCLCDIYIFLNYSETYITKLKPTVRSQQKVKRIEVRLSGAVFFEKNPSSEDSSFVPRNYERRLKGGSLYVIKREHLVNNKEVILMKKVMTEKR